MQETGKLLTLILPAFNMEAYLRACLDSILAGNPLAERLDVLVVNDGSTDSTSTIAHGYEKAYPGIVQAIDKSNGNYGSCINAALPLASGFFVKVVDADDSVDSDTFAELLLCLSREADTGETAADLVVTDYVAVDPAGKVVDRIRYEFPVGSGRRLDEAQPGSPRFTIHSVVYKTDILRKTGYRQTEGMSYTDTEWITEPMAAVKRVTYLPIAVTKYLVGRSGQTMEDATFATRFQQVVRITEGLVSRYPSVSCRCVPDSRSYYKARVVEMVSMVYHAWLVGWSGCRVRCNLCKLDSIIRETPEIRSIAESFRAPSRVFPLRFVAARLRPFGMGIPSLALLRTFLWLRRINHRVRNSFQPRRDGSVESRGTSRVAGNHPIC